MDKFLHEQSAGQLVDRDNEFTISREKARSKTLESAPQVELENIFRLLDGAIVDLGYSPGDCFTYRSRSDFSTENFYLELPSFSPQRASALLSEIRAPFGSDRTIRKFAQAILLAVTSGCTVELNFPPRSLSLLGPPTKFQLSADTLEVPDNIDVSNAASMSLKLTPARKAFTVESAYPNHRASPSRWLCNSLKTPERILPMESLLHEVDGFFRGRVRPFTLLRSYAYQTQDDPAPGLKVDLWEGPYSFFPPSTLLLQQKKSKNFWFIRWRPSYGRPTLLHRSLDSPLEFGETSCRGTFMVLPTEEPARVYFISEGVVADPVVVEGPRGLVGLVSWAGFRYDFWGTRPVENEVYQEALSWTKTQIDKTAWCVDEYLEYMIQRVCESSLLCAHYYSGEVANKMRYLWSRSNKR